MFLTTSGKVYCKIFKYFLTITLGIGNRFENSIENEKIDCQFDDKKYESIYVGENITCMLDIPKEIIYKNKKYKKIEKNQFSDILIIVK